MAPENDGTGTMIMTDNAREAPNSLTTEPTAVRVIQERHGLDELAPAWDLHAARSGRPMQSYAWFHACASTFLTDGRLHVMVAGEPPHITAIAPLVRQRNGIGRLELLGVNELYEPTDFLFAEPSALVPLAQRLAQSRTPLFLNRIPADSPAVEILKQAYRWRGVVVCRPIAGAPWLPLDDDWKQPEHRLTSRRCSDLRRARRIAESMGTVSSDVLSPAPADLEPLLEEAFQVEAASWKGRSRSALANDAIKGAFFRRYVAAACREGILRLCFLRIGGRAVAMQLAVECGGRFWLLKIGYDEAFARCSPGVLLLVETMRYAAIRGLRSYEFLGTLEPWMHIWNPRMTPCISLLAYPANGKGLAALATDVASMARSRLGGII